MGDGAGIAIRKGENELREKFNAAIKAIRANGKYKEINDKYFDFDAYGAEAVLRPPPVLIVGRWPSSRRPDKANA